MQGSAAHGAHIKDKDLETRVLRMVLVSSGCYKTVSQTGQHEFLFQRSGG